MNEKSKAFELIEFVWNNEKTDSYLRVNIAMYEAVKLAIISQMKFNKEDFQNIFSKFSGGYWFGVNAPVVTISFLKSYWMKEKRSYVLQTFR